MLNNRKTKNTDIMVNKRKNKEHTEHTNMLNTRKTMKSRLIKTQKETHNTYKKGKYTQHDK